MVPDATETVFGVALPVRVKLPVIVLKLTAVPAGILCVIGTGIVIVLSLTAEMYVFDDK